MKIVTIEPTPSPNSMKIVLDTELPKGTVIIIKKVMLKQHQSSFSIIEHQWRKRNLSRHEFHGG